MQKTPAKLPTRLALVATIVTMGLIAYIVQGSGEVSEVGSGPFWIVFAGVLIGAVVMIIALVKAVANERETRSASPDGVDLER